MPLKLKCRFYKAVVRTVMDHNVCIRMLNSGQSSGIEDKCSGDETAKVDE